MPPAISPSRHPTAPWRIEVFMRSSSDPDQRRCLSLERQCCPADRCIIIASLALFVLRRPRRRPAEAHQARAYVASIANGTVTAAGRHLGNGGASGVVRTTHLTFFSRRPWTVLRRGRQLHTIPLSV